MNLKTHFETFESYVPVDLSEPKWFAVAFLVVFTFIVLRYFFFVGAFYFMYWKRRRDRGVESRVLHNQMVRPGQVAFEIKWSMISSLIFSLAGVMIGWLWQQGWTQMYLELNRYGVAYLFFSLILVSLIHEVYFYVTHVWMHRPKVFKYVHYVHHYSNKTTPWASFSFHPYESIIQAIFLPAIILIVPLHPVAILTYLTFMTVTAISNHLGYELIRSKVLRSLFISGGHHNLHHEKFSCNFGLYYTWIDKIFKTEAKVKT